MEFGLGVDEWGRGIDIDRASPLVNKQMAMTTTGNVVGRERMLDGSTLWCDVAFFASSHRWRPPTWLSPPHIQNDSMSLIRSLTSILVALITSWILSCAADGSGKWIWVSGLWIGDWWRRIFPPKFLFPAKYLKLTYEIRNYRHMFHVGIRRIVPANTTKKMAGAPHHSNSSILWPWHCTMAMVTMITGTWQCSIRYPFAAHGSTNAVPKRCR